MNNGAEVFAKLPNLNAGPAHFTVASEVATRESLRDIFNVPVPQVLVWSCDATKNSVEAEFIIEEKVVELENTLTTIIFDRQGCIYFKDDPSALIGEAKEIHTDSAGALERYSIGPLTSNELWSGAKRDMDLDRGPWKDPREYAEALGRNEMALIESHAVPRMNYYRSSQSKELPEDGIALVKKYIDVAPYLVPSPTDGSGNANVLWHPDLHLDNIFVDPNTYQITRIVDWQSACVAPLFYQSGVPKLCKKNGHVREGWVVPRRPEDLESLSESEQKRIDEDLENEILHKYYEAQVCKRTPRHWAVLQQQAVPTIRKPVWLVTGAWENRDLFFLRESFMELVADWEELFPESLVQLAVLPVDGMVDPKDFDIARENCRKFKEIFVGLGKDDDERELF
ncbi:phosphotransferase enzyme family protein [Penicillium viridicatum]|nr:phosphotransferase enzyme family protein [Penicillium viridicatum]